ncbi:hypothetical protein PIIN_00867 [Serendipita indica DSM 11827]|uniref:LysM domain-containing protein n=1 Tax=Serendipita indica (strain DSM 11827) TaxID=1109443 RepID=G4T6R3_SERID|nr:hypothetical protein PIIN_00867 [Serendipita indica DSM 11827]
MLYSAFFALIASAVIISARPLVGRDNITVMCSGSVLVAEGDTCASIAAANNVTPVAFEAINMVMRTEFSCDSLVTGMRLCIPTAGVTDPGVAPNYVAWCKESPLTEPGQTCQSIADAHGVTLREFYYTQVLMRGSFECDPVPQGTRVCIPGSGASESGSGSSSTSVPTSTA